MLFPRLSVAVFCLVMVGSCSKKAKNQTSGEYVAAVLSEDAVPASNRPTRPTGGFVEGKSSATIDPEEAERRRNKNMIEPIIFGASAAGITMNTPYSEAQQLLSLYGSNQGADFFSEHIYIVWNDGADPVPFELGILNGYAGKLALPAPYGDVSVGQPMANFLVTFDDLKRFMLTIGAAFENQPVATYDCEKALTCQQREDQTFYILDFKRGGIFLSKEDGLPIGFMYLTQPQKFYAPVIDPMLHNLSIGGLTFQTRRSTAELRLGPSLREQQEAGGFIYNYYDQFNLAIEWGADGTPRSFKALNQYRGPLNFGTVIGSRKIGDSFQSLAPENDDGTQLMLALDRDLNRRAADYNCATQATPTCQRVLDTLTNRVLIVIDRSVYGFTNTPVRTWLSVGMIEP